MRAIWKGAVSFGLVSIAVKLYAATEEKDIRFHQVHQADGGRIRYRRVCSVCNEEVPYDDIAKGYDLGGGEMVVLTDEDFIDLPLATSHAIDVLEFVPADQVDPILYHRTYYLEPEGMATKPYALLRDALTDSERVAIVKVALRQREQLATLRVRDKVLVLNTMLWPDEVRTPEFSFLDEDVTTRPAELAMASSLIESMSADFHPEQYTDNYREALQEVIDAKVSGRRVVAPPEVPAAPTAAVDLMAALRASVERARQARGELAAAEPGVAAESGGAPQPGAAGEAQPGAKPTPISAARSAKRAVEKKKAAEPAAGQAKKAGGKAARKTARMAGEREAAKSTAKAAASKKAEKPTRTRKTA